MLEYDKAVNLMTKYSELHENNVYWFEQQLKRECQLLL